jgi:DNA-binding MarR family transcriptional regulator
MDEWQTAVALLRVSGQLVEGIQRGMRRRGFDDVRPAHGFAFVMLSAGPATAAQLAEYLGITKQAASELVAHLVDGGYLRRRPDPSDGRRVLLELTDRGRGCTAAAEDAAREKVRQWRYRLPARRIDALAVTLQALAEPGPLRPSW